MAPNSGFFSAFNKANLSQKIIILSLTVLYSSTAILSIPLAIVFKEPLILCTDPETETTFQCPEVEACTNNYRYIISKDDGPKSFSSQYELICEEQWQKRMALTCIFFGYLLAAALQTFYIIDAKKRRVFIFWSGIALFVVLLLILMVDIFHLKFILIAWLFFFAGTLVLYPITYIYIYVNENFQGELSTFSMVFLEMGWGVIGILYAVLGWFFNADWRYLMGLGCILTITSSIIFYATKLEKNKINPEDEEEEDDDAVEEAKVGLWSYCKDMWPNTTIRINFIVYTLAWSLYCMIYTLQYVELGSVGGNVYFNTVFCCVLEICAAFFASIIIKKYSCEKMLKLLVFIEGIFFSIFLFAPPSISVSSGLQTTFFVTCLLITKTCNDLLTLMIYLGLPKMFTDKYIGLYVIISRGFARVFMIFLPTINYTVRSYGLHPFVFYGVVFLILRFLLSYCKEVQADGIEELINETDIGILQRMAVASGSHSMGGSMIHDKILKKIRVEGVPLSMIRKYKHNPDSIKLSAKMSTALMHKLTASKSAHHKMNLYELKQSLKANEMS